MAAAAAVGILGRRIASAVLSFEFMLAGNWVVAFYHIVDTMGGCLGMGGSVSADSRCRHLMSYPPAVAAVSLLLMLWLWRRELKAKAVGGRKDGRTDPDLGMEKGPERCCLRESDSVAVFGIIFVYSSCILVMFLGGMVRYAGENLLLKDPTDKGAAAQVQAGFVISDVGILSFEFGHCLLFIPYMLLRVRSLKSQAGLRRTLST